MIEVTKCSFTGSCSSCQSNSDVVDYNIGRVDPLTNKINSGVKISLCKKCREQMIKMLKENEE